MSANLPRPNMARFAPLAPEAVTLFFLSCQKQGMSLATLQRRLQKVMSAARVDAAVSSLIESGAAGLERVVALTQQGREMAKQQLGLDAAQSWDKLKDRRLPMIALGLNPDDAELRKRFAKADALKIATISVAYGLPKESMGKTAAVGAELVWLALRSGVPELVGRGPFPPIDKLGVVERVILAGLAGTKAKSTSDAINGLAARAVGLDKIDAAGLRERLIEIAVERATSAPMPEISEQPLLNQTAKVATTVIGPKEFATRVRDLAKTLATPPFEGRVSIAQIYDAYGKVHPDAGSLASFKDRLVAAAKARMIDLGRLDLPERMSNELRQRSKTPWGSDEVHFVITSWK